jgi:hypothetical protein
MLTINAADNNNNITSPDPLPSTTHKPHTSPSTTHKTTHTSPPSSTNKTNTSPSTTHKPQTPQPSTPAAESVPSKRSSPTSNTSTEASKKLKKTTSPTKINKSETVNNNTQHTGDDMTPVSAKLKPDLNSFITTQDSRFAPPQRKRITVADAPLDLTRKK